MRWLISWPGKLCLILVMLVGFLIFRHVFSVIWLGRSLSLDPCWDHDVLG
jgi:hypothetical protein